MLIPADVIKAEKSISYFFVFYLIDQIMKNTIKLEYVILLQNHVDY